MESKVRARGEWGVTILKGATSWTSAGRWLKAQLTVMRFFAKFGDMIGCFVLMYTPTILRVH